MAVLWTLSAIGLLVVAPLVVVLAQRIIRPALECARYADDILEHGVGITRALDPVPALATTRELVAQVAGGAGDYAVALQRVAQASPRTG